MNGTYFSKKNGHTVHVTKVEQCDGGKRVYYVEGTNKVKTMGRNRFVRQHSYVKGDRV